MLIDNRMNRVMQALVLLSSAATLYAQADSSTSDQQQKIQELEKKVDALQQQVNGGGDSAKNSSGEKKGFTSPTPQKSFDPLHHGGWGALELAIRVGDFEVERGILTMDLPAAQTRRGGPMNGWVPLVGT